MQNSGVGKIDFGILSKDQCQGQISYNYMIINYKCFEENDRMLLTKSCLVLGD